VENAVAPQRFSTLTVDSHRVLDAPAPSAVEFQLDPEMHDISGHFGVRESNWADRRGPSAGVDFFAKQLAPDKTVIGRRRRRPSGLEGWAGEPHSDPTSI
jgi:hypothetical protein